MLREGPLLASGGSAWPGAVTPLRASLPALPRPQTCSVPEDSSWGRQGRVARVLWRGGMSWEALIQVPSKRSCPLLRVGDAASVVLGL